jgi:hypothetical protein
MIRKGLFASTLVASALFAAPQAHAAINFGSISNIVNQLHSNSTFLSNSLAFAINNGGQNQTLFSGIAGVRAFNANPANIAQINSWADTASQAPSGYNGYKFTYSVVGGFFSAPASSMMLDSGDAGEAAPQARMLRTNAAIPEPGTWVMMILGMGVVGMTLRRRANHKAKYFA